MDAVIVAFGVFINDFPYFMLAMTLMWSHLRYNRRHAFFVMLAMTALHATSILLLTTFLPPDAVETIKVPHEIAFMAVYVAGFVWAVKLKPLRLLFIAFFVKFFADVVVHTVIFIQMTFWPDTFIASFNLRYNLIHFALLCILWPLMYLFVRRVLQRLYLLESEVWRFLWILPAAFYALLTMLSNNNREKVTSLDFIVPAVTLFVISLLVYMLIFETLRTTLARTQAEIQKDAAVREAETEKELNRSKTNFLQDMSHEMKNPLTVIATGIDLADEQAGDGGDAAKLQNTLDVVRDETQRLGRMVGGMIKLASMSDVDGSRTRVDLANLLQSNAEVCRLSLEKQGNQLLVEIMPGLPDVYVESDRFSQIITNLVFNAARHTKEGQVSITAEFDKEYISVRVADTGEGIDSELLPRVFERGVSGAGGTGYGLYICKTIVEAHGGMLNVESEPGCGTEVTFTIPIYGGQEARHTL